MGQTRKKMLQDTKPSLTPSPRQRWLGIGEAPELGSRAQEHNLPSPQALGLPSDLVIQSESGHASDNS